MAASTTDLLTKVGDPGTATTLSAPGYTTGGTSINVGSTTHFPSTTAFVFAIDEVETVGGEEVRVAGTYNTYLGIVTSGTQISSVTWLAGDGDRDYAAGAGTRVYITTASAWANRLIDGLSVEHNNDGTHSAVTADSIAVSGTSSFTGALTVKSYDGWITETRTWTYASGTGTNVGTFTVAGVDLTAVYNVGDRVKFTQTTVKYGIITKVAFSTDTTVTIYMGTDYTIANAAITSPAYSHDRSPVGFPMDPSKWTVSASTSSDTTKTSPTISTWYGDTGLTSTGLSITIPIGVWDVRWEAIGFATKSSATAIDVNISLSTSASSETDTDFTGFAQIQAATGTLSIRPTLTRRKTLALAASTTYYLIAKTEQSSVTTVGMSGAHTPTIIKAICAYL